MPTRAWLFAMIVALWGSCSAGPSSFAVDPLTVTSPDGNLSLSFALKANPQPYIGGMTNWDPRDLEIPLSFLGSGQYEAKDFADGPDADKVATSLNTNKKLVRPADTLPVHMAPGGGVAVILTRVP